MVSAFSLQRVYAVPSAGRLAEGSPDGYFNARRVGAPQTGISMPGLSVLPLVRPRRGFGCPPCRCSPDGYFNARRVGAPLVGLG